MKRFLSLVFIFSCWILSGPLTLCAQSDTGLKNKSKPGEKIVDSVKNAILINQSDQIKAAKVEQISDSIRIIQLEQQLLDIGNKDERKRKSLTVEKDKISTKDSIRWLIQKQKIDSLRARISGFSVVLGQDSLFSIFSNLGSFSPKERADAISSRIRKISQEFKFNEDSVLVGPAEFLVNISYKDVLITSVTDLDALWAGTTKEKLADQYRMIMAKGITKYRDERSWPRLLRESLTALLVICVLWLIIFLIVRFFKWIKSEIERQKGVKIKGVRIRNYEFLDTNRQVAVINTLLNFLKWILILVVVYLTLPILLGIFPYTGGLATNLISYFLDPVQKIFSSIVDYLPNLITIIVLCIVFRYILKILLYFKSEIERGALKIPGFYVDWANPTFQIVRVLLYAFMLIVIFPYLPGSNSQIFKGVSVFLGVLFTFGSAGALGNVVSGLVLTYMRAYKIGDRVKIAGAEGDIVEKSLLVTRIRTIKNEIISIPNTNVMSGHTINYSAVARENGLIIHTTVTIGYDAHWRQIHELLINAALKTENIEKDPAPFVFQTSLDDFYVSYQINAYTREANKQHITYSFLHENIQDVFNEAGVEIMSAHYEYLRDGNKITVPKDHLPKDYITPSFRVKRTDGE